MDERIKCRQGTRDAASMNKSRPKIVASNIPRYPPTYKGLLGVCRFNPARAKILSTKSTLRDLDLDFFFYRYVVYIIFLFLS